MNTLTGRILNVTRGKNLYIAIKTERLQDHYANFLMLHIYSKTRL